MLLLLNKQSPVPTKKAVGSFNCAMRPVAVGLPTVGRQENGLLLRFPFQGAAGKISGPNRTDSSPDEHG
jgi:hypothetical protein